MRQPLFLIIVALGCAVCPWNPAFCRTKLYLMSLVRGNPPSAGQHDDRVQHHTHEGSIGNLCNDLIRKKNGSRHWRLPFRDSPGSGREALYSTTLNPHLRLAWESCPANTSKSPGSSPHCLSARKNERLSGVISNVTTADAPASR